MGRDTERALDYVAERSILVPHGCRLWTRSLTTDGYAKAVITEAGRERTVRVHRWLMEQVHGPLPARAITAHSCNESLCVDIDHLSSATQRTNMRQMSDQGRAAGRAHLGYADTRGSLGAHRPSRPHSARGSTWTRPPPRCWRAKHAACPQSTGRRV